MFYEHIKQPSQGRENFVLTKTKLFLTTKMLLMELNLDTTKIFDEKFLVAEDSYSEHNHEVILRSSKVSLCT